MFPAVLAEAAVAAPAAPAPVIDVANPVVFLGMLMTAVITLVAAANQIDAMIQRRKRTPPIESEFVTKTEFRDFKTGLESELRITRIAVEKLTTSINRDFNTLYRALGKVEGVTLDERRDAE